MVGPHGDAANREAHTPAQSAVTLPPRRAVKRWLRRVLLVVFLLTSLALAGALTWKRWHQESMPAPPEMVLTGLDPALAESIAAARDRVLREPNSAEAWGQLGKLLRTPGLIDEADFCYAQAEKLDPPNVRWPYLRGEAVMLADPDAAFPHLRRAVEVGDRTEPDNIVPRLRLAEVLVARGLNDEAEHLLRRSHEIDPDNPTVRYDLGVLADSRGDLEESRRLLLTCQYSEFTRQKACHHLAALYQRLGNTEQAVKFAQKARDLPKDFDWPDKYIMDYKLAAVGKQTRLQYVDRLEAQGKSEEAIQVLQEILADGPDYRAYVGLGKLLVQRGDLDGAERALHEAIKLTPANARAHRYLSPIHLARGDRYQREGSDQKARQEFHQAAEAVGKALAQKPDDAEALVLRGQALQRLGQKAEALAAFRAAVECGPELVEPHFYLAEALTEAGQMDEARTHWQRVVLLAKPDNRRRKPALERLGEQTKSN